MTRITLISLVLSLASGCALNAVLEVDMLLPYDPGRDERPIALVEVSTTRPPPLVDGLGGWNEEWREEERVFNLASGENPCAAEGRNCNVRFSVVTENIDVEFIYIKVTFCRAEDCTELGEASNPAFWGFVLERPFYRESRTRWSPTREDGLFVLPLDRQPPLPIPEVDPPPFVVDRCSIEGCARGNPVITDFGWCDGELGDTEPGDHWCVEFPSAD